MYLNKTGLVSRFCVGVSLTDPVRLQNAVIPSVLIVKVQEEL